MAFLDVFSNDAFSIIELTAAVNDMPFRPGQVGRTGVFDSKGVATTKIAIEEKDGVLYLVPTSLRGAPGTMNQNSKRRMREFRAPHLQVNDRVMADEIQNVRELGGHNQLKTIQGVVSERLETMIQSLDVTLEHLQLGAIRGQILDADGSSVLFDLFTEFGVAQEAEIDFDLDNANPASGIIRKKCASVVRAMANNLGAAQFEKVHCFCGDNFFDDLVAHPEVRETYMGQQQAAELRNGYAYGTLNFGGITFENYRGTVGGVGFVNTDKCHFFPVGVPGLFQTFFAPGDYIDVVNTLGLPRYAKSAPDASFAKWVDLEAQSNPLPLCTRPAVLMQGKRT
jgi:hypothetical protein